VKTPFSGVDLGKFVSCSAQTADRACCLCAACAVVVRENTEDLYTGEEKWVDKDTVEGIKRITRGGSVLFSACLPPLASLARQPAEPVGRYSAPRAASTNIATTAYEYAIRNKVVR
jgi:isocitrate/isopropylmalate dehydrogenase